MPNVIIAVLFVLALAAGCGRQDSLPANQRPMYGGIEKSDAQKKADADLVAGIKAKGFTLEQGSENAVKFGWEAFHKKDRDLAVAMQRFNQAWLLDPENGDAYHGFALVSYEKGSPPDEVDKYFQLALSKQKVGINAHVDYGRFLWTQKKYRESLAQLQKALEIDPKAWKARSHISFVYYKMGDYALACEWAQKAKENKDPLEKGYLEDMCSKAGK
ncbi:tetratricopeptide repeat protein [Fundidesulfovibrio terrae]|uniref:tetratricopeptide repeat protein n=1 Tax=Fundidesulfovibrio terrae TaxID=2922866 RepID=UPI001FB02380|nr:tetratricopeptide repeat protein [Fundidesulfovibrio terrae]